MAEYKIIIKNRDNVFDAEGERIKKDILDLGIKKNISVKTAQVYKISGDIVADKINEICEEVLVDPVAQHLSINAKNLDSEKSVEVYYKAGVTDSVSETVRIGIKDIGISNPLIVRTGKKYFFSGDITKNELEKIAGKLLSNDVVQEYELTYEN